VHTGTVLSGLSLEFSLPLTVKDADKAVTTPCRDWAAWVGQVAAAINQTLQTVEPGSATRLADRLLLMGGNAKHVAPHFAAAIKMAADGAPLRRVRPPMLATRPEELVLTGAQLLAARAAVDLKERTRLFVTYEIYCSKEP